MKKQELYSPDFQFFLNHQILVVVFNGGHSIKLSSRLDGRLFFAELDNKKWSNDDRIKEKCYEIHKTLEYYA
jgi:hypothetical protein